MVSEKAIKFGINLRELRSKHRFTVREAAMRSNISPAYWSQLENGKREIPKPITLNKIANGLSESQEIIYKIANLETYNKSSENRFLPELSNKEKLDLGKLADMLLEGSTMEAESDYFGEPSTPEQKANLRAAIMTALELNKQQAKKKFTPKKYRKNKD